MLSLVAFISVVRIRRRILLKQRLKGKEVPYVVGEVIKDRSMFFGRKDDIQELRNSIAGSSYLLLAYFRSGKTSLQHQLELVAPVPSNFEDSVCEITILSW